MTDSRKKSILKTLTWMILVIMTTSIVLYYFIGNLYISIGAGSGIEILESIMYYLHERAWSKY